MLVHFFLQSMVLFAVLAIVRWDVAWAYVPLLPLALRRAAARSPARSGILLSAINVYLRDTQHFLELALLAWFWVTPIVYGFMTIGAPRRAGSPKVYMLNPVTPIVLMFQRAIYAKLDNPKVSDAATAGAPDPAALAVTGLPRVPRLFVRVRRRSCSRSRSAVFGRSEANFAEEL